MSILTKVLGGAAIAAAALAMKGNAKKPATAKSKPSTPKRKRKPAKARRAKRATR